MMMHARALFLGTTLIVSAGAVGAGAQDRPKFFDDFSGSFAITNDYRFRGVSQTMRDSAL